MLLSISVPHSHVVSISGHANIYTIASRSDSPQQIQEAHDKVWSAHINIIVHYLSLRNSSCVRN